jgi:hypothetical protein
MLQHYSSILQQSFEKCNGKALGKGQFLLKYNEDARVKRSKGFVLAQKAF